MNGSHDDVCCCFSGGCYNGLFDVVGVVHIKRGMMVLRLLGE